MAAVRDKVVEALSAIPFFFWFNCQSCGMMFTSNVAVCPQCNSTKVEARVYRTGYMFKADAEKGLQQMKEYFTKLNWKVRSASVQDVYGAFSAIVLVQPGVAAQPKPAASLQPQATQKPPAASGPQAQLKPAPTPTSQKPQA